MRGPKGIGKGKGEIEEVGMRGAGGEEERGGREFASNKYHPL
jgi:hypothetical protein